MDQLQNSPVIREETRAEGKAAFLPVFALIEQGQKEGTIKQIDMESILYFLAGTLTTFVRWMHSTDKKNQKTRLEQQVQMVWDGIKA